MVAAAFILVFASVFLVNFFGTRELYRHNFYDFLAGLCFVAGVLLAAAAAAKVLWAYLP